jgi:Ca-activated chloride channel family protein
MSGRKTRRIGLAVSLLMLGLAVAPLRAVAQSPEPLELLFTYGSEKKRWVEEVTRAFNGSEQTTASGRPIQVTHIPMGSGQSLQEVANGTRQAHLVSPASGVFIELANADYQERAAKDLVGATHNLVLSPVVIAMWQPMAEALGWPDRAIGWSDVLALANSTDGWSAYGHPEWGAFKFGHTHPLHSNSGILSLLAEVYAATGKTRGLTVADVTDPATYRFVSGVERSVVHYGRSTGFFGRKMLQHGPEFLSAAVLYESSVIESYDPGLRLSQPLVAIYPKEGTFWSNHPVGIVQRDWVTPEHREAAGRYIGFLLEPAQQRRAMAHGFRPADVDVPLGDAFTGKGVDLGQPKTVLRVPPAKVMREVLKLWQGAKKKADLVLVLDISGSMRGDKLARAKQAAQRLVQGLGTDDRVSLLAFNNNLYWMKQGVRAGPGRDSVLAMIDALDAFGGTSFYDAIADAYAYLKQEPAADSIPAVVVLTDGADSHSQLKLEPLLARIRLTRDSEIRVFPIGYGAKVAKDVMERIAGATQVKAYQGTPENIDKVFFDISTFF